jgi:DNA-binding CsgD family transcriptional regulator/tetratricopeptide (TPR) repeat protein
LALYEEGLSLYRKLNDSRGMAACLGSLGWIAVHRGDHEWATEVLEEGLARYRELGDKSGVVSVLPPLGALASRKGDQERAMAFVEESLVLYRELEDVGNVALSLSNLGWLALVQGDHERAAKLLNKSLAGLKEAGLKPLANIPMELGLAVLARGDDERATELLVEGLTLSRQVGDTLNTVNGLEGMAVTARVQSETERAARLWGAAEMLREAMGVPLRPDERAVYEPYMAEARSQLDAAAWEAALAEGRAMTLEEAVGYALSEDTPVTPASAEQQVTGKTPATLTRREQEIAVLVARGLTNRQIASELSISEHTAATHVAKILKKLGLQSRAQIGSWLAE